MNVQINQLVRSLLKKDNLEQCSLQEVQVFAERHPYFGAAQLLLAKKLQTESPAQYDEQLQKTFLFFHNPLWVEHLLNGTGKADVSLPEKKPAPVIEPIVIVETEPIPEPDIPTIPVMEIAEEKIINTEELSSETMIEQSSAVFDQPVENIIHESTNEPVTGTMIEPVTEKDEPRMEIPQLKIEPIDPAKAELVFEPYHTVDYFASQGIKFKEEEKPTDKFGKQLKSFTDWLKTMKRLPVTEIAKTVETVSEKKVEQLAEHSLEDREVVTEAMAEVWEKQGNMGKAIEVYRKLSLLDPSKSPYFAAKIEDLNKLT